MLSNGIITAPVSISNVKECLSESTYDLGKLCTSSKINAYSKYKPMRINTTAIATEEQMKAINYGYSYPDTDLTPKQIYELVVKGTIPVDHSAPANSVHLQNLWYYLIPTGGSTYPYRLGDFINYSHNVPKSMLDLNYETMVFVINQAGEDHQFMFSVNSQGGSHQLQVSDLDNMSTKTYRFGILVTKNGLKYTYCGCANTVMNQNTFYIAKSNLSSLFTDGAGNYYVIPILSNGQSSSTPEQVTSINVSIGIPLPTPYCTAIVTVDESGGVVDYGFSISNAELVGRNISFTFHYNENFAGKTASYGIYQQDGTNDPFSLSNGTIQTSTGTTQYDFSTMISMPAITDNTRIYVTITYGTTSVTKDISY